jgi:hypothetical protein
MEQHQAALNLQDTLIQFPYFSESFSEIKPDLEREIFVHRAKTEKDFQKVFYLRWQGYKKYCYNQNNIMDQFDFSPNCTLLVAEDEYHNAVGTLRILDRRFGKIGLDEFIDVDALLSGDEKKCVQAARLSIPKHPNAKLIKHLLWKALLLYCLATRVNVIIYSVRPCISRLYRCLLFENVGPSGVYNHTLLGNLEHHTYKCVIDQKREELRQKNPTLYHFFFEEDHPNITM